MCFSLRRSLFEMCWFYMGIAYIAHPLCQTGKREKKPQTNYALFGLVVRNPYMCFVRNFVARGKLLSGKFGDFVPLALGKAIINQGPGQI